jgi:hypothetical protein
VLLVIGAILAQLWEALDAEIQRLEREHQALTGQLAAL